MNVRTLTELDARAEFGDATAPCRVPAGTVVTDIEFENPDRSVGIPDGTARGTVVISGVDIMVDFGGNTWDWWGEPPTDPDSGPVPGWFEVIDPDAEGE